MNLPEVEELPMGCGPDGAKMKDCRWLKPMLASQIEFLVTGRAKITFGTPNFIALRDDKPARGLRRE